MRLCAIRNASGVVRWLLTIVGGDRERLVVTRRGRGKTVCARGAHGTLLGGPSTSPLGARMRSLLTLTAAFAAALYSAHAAVASDSAGAAPIHCVVSNPLSCPNTNYLSWSPGFGAAVTGFLGPKKADYFRANQTLSWQAQYGLGGPPDPRKSLPGGLFLFGACPPHDCAGQAAAIVLNDHGAIEGIGFSSFHCGGKCDFDHRYLDFYVRRGPTSDTVATILNEWGHGSGIRSMLHDPKVDDGLTARTTVELVQ